MKSVELQKELKKLYKQKDKLEKQIEALELEYSKTKEAEEIESGVDPRLVKFFNYDVPSNDDNDYMVWGISDEALVIFEKYVRLDYLNRYQTYYFTDLFYDSFFDELREQEKIGKLKKGTIKIFEDILNSESKLKNLNDLDEKCLKLFNELETFYYGITSDQFKFDW